MVVRLLLFGVAMNLLVSSLGLDSLPAIQQNGPAAKAARMPNLGLILVAGFAPMRI